MAAGQKFHRNTDGYVKIEQGLSIPLAKASWVWIVLTELTGFAFEMKVVAAAAARTAR